jgi:hypothetical protein
LGQSPKRKGRWRLCHFSDSGSLGIFLESDFPRLINISIRTCTGCVSGEIKICSSQVVFATRDMTTGSWDMGLGCNRAEEAGGDVHPWDFDGAQGRVAASMMRGACRKADRPQVTIGWALGGSHVSTLDQIR